MTNKNFSMVDGKCIGIAPNLTPRLHRADSVSIVSRQSLLPILLLCLTLFIGVGQMWGAAGDALQTMASSDFTSSYARKTPTGHVGYGQTNYLGANNVTTHGNIKPTNADLPVVKAVNASATTNSTGLYYWYSTSPQTNVGSITFYYSAVSKANGATPVAYIVYSSTPAANNSTTWEKVTLANTSTCAQGENVAAAGTYTFTFATTQTSAKYYGIVIQTSGFVRMKDASLTIKEGSSAPACSKNVNVIKGTEDNTKGTFTLSKSGNQASCDGFSVEVTPTAATHYHLAATNPVTASNPATSGTATVSDPSNGKYTVTYSAESEGASTIDVAFEEDPTYTVTWVAGSTSSFHTQTNYTGTSLTDPGTPDADLYCPGGKEFVGWTTTPIVGEQQNEPEDLFTSVSGKSIPIGGTTYYAVFADVDSDSEEQTLSFDASNFNLTSTYAVKTCTVDGYSFKVDKGYLNGTSNIQMNSSQGNGKLYNTTSIPGLKSVRLNVASGSNTKTVYSGSTSGSTTHNLGTTTSSSKTFDVEEGDTYFTILVSGANYLSSVVVTYEETSSVASNYATTCCTPLASINGSFF